MKCVSNLTVELFAAPNVWIGVTVTNVGSIAAHEVTQLYVTAPGAGSKEPHLPIPIRSLQGFTRRFLPAGGSLRLSFELTPRQISTVQRNGSAVLGEGTYTVSVGGCQPGDPAGLKLGNVLSASFTRQ